jgi:hypothetical protein
MRTFFKDGNLVLELTGPEVETAANASDVLTALLTGASATAFAAPIAAAVLACFAMQIAINKTWMVQVSKDGGNKGVECIWPSPFYLVLGWWDKIVFTPAGSFPTIGPARPLPLPSPVGLENRRLACGRNAQGDLHVCATDSNGGLWHTIRIANGSWPVGFRDVEAELRRTGLPSLGATPMIACATNAQGDLHVCAIDGQGGLWHTIRLANGSWVRFGDVQAQTSLLGPSIGPTSYVACATDAQGDLHICAVDEHGGLWHTIRRADGTWPQAFGDVQAQTTNVGPSIGPTPHVACATNAQGDLHICAIDAQGGLWHTVRRADGSWPFAFGDVQAQTRLSGPSIGPTPHVACATNAQGDLHICAIDVQGGLWHTMRRADGAWPIAFGDVQSQTRLVGPNPGIGPTPYAACTTNTEGDLHICALNAKGGLWHTIRQANGGWPSAFGDVNAEVGRLP